MEEAGDSATGIGETLREREALAESRAFLDSVIEHSPHALWVSDERGTLVRLNQACRELFHLKDSEVVGKYNVFEDGIVEAQGHMPAVRAVFENGTTAHFPLHYDSAQLTSLELAERVVVDLEVTISPVLDADGRVAHAVIQHVDVTARERALAELRASQRQLQAVFDTSPTGIFVSRAADGMILDANRALTEQFQVDRESALGHTSLELGLFSDPDDRARMLEVLERDGSLRDFETRVVTARGDQRVVLVSSAPLELDGERVLVGTISDISRRKQMEDELHQSAADLERKVGERTAELRDSVAELEAFAYSVSHDLRAPLRHISGYAGMLEEDYGDALSEQGHVFLGALRHSVVQMDALIGALLEFSRAGRGALKLARVDMNALVAEAKATVSDSMEGRNIEWRIGTLPEVLGDAGLLRQVWVNLLGNAVKYTRPRAHARIEVRAVETPGEHEFCVADNGVGFDMQYADRLFGVFQRLHSDSRFEGVGIGLANVRRVITRHGGRTWAEGVVDGGAVFGFSLPRTPVGARRG